MDFLIRPALMADRRSIVQLHRSLHRPLRRVLISEYFVAEREGEIVGCAAVRVFPTAGYLYGLAVRQDCRRAGIGAALVSARMAAIAGAERKVAVLLAMFWNVAFFRKLGFATVRRDELPPMIRRIGDLRNPRYKRSAVLWTKVGA
jgi:N-acetylglutamate synthase-like GNAT family acetyltransferase